MKYADEEYKSEEEETLADNELAGCLFAILLIIGIAAVIAATIMAH